MANCVWTSTPHPAVAPPSADSVSSRRLARLCNLSFARTLPPSVVRNSSSSRRIGIYCSSDGAGGQNQTETTGIQLYRDIERLDRPNFQFDYAGCFFPRLISYNINSVISSLLYCWEVVRERLFDEDNFLTKRKLWDSEMENLRRLSR